MHDNKLKKYILDICEMIKNQAIASKSPTNKYSESCDDVYNIGYLMAFHSVLSILKKEADIFEINQEDIGLANIDPDMDLLGLNKKKTDE